MKSLFDQALDLNLEFEADRLGADDCSRVGYDPNGTRRWLLPLQSLGEMRWIPFWSPPILLSRSVWTQWMSNLQESAPAKGHERKDVYKRFRASSVSAESGKSTPFTISPTIWRRAPARGQRFLLHPR